MTNLKTISRQLDSLCDQVKQTDEKVEIIRHHLIGTLEERGLTRRVEDIEDRERKRSRYITAALLAGTAAVITWPVRMVWSAIAGDSP